MNYRDTDRAVVLPSRLLEPMQAFATSTSDGATPTDWGYATRQPVDLGAREIQLEDLSAVWNP